MQQQQYSAFHSFSQKLASSCLGSWLFARILHHLDRAFFKAAAGRATLSSVLAGMPELLVTTVGARSGLPRTIPLVCIYDEADPKTFALIASNWGQPNNPAWYYNLKAHPQAACSIGGQARDYVAHEATGAEYDKFWRLASATYLGYPLYKQRAGGRHIPIMVMSPLPRPRE